MVPFAFDSHSTSHVKNDDAHRMSFKALESKPFMGERDLLVDVSGLFRSET